VEREIHLIHSRLLKDLETKMEAQVRLTRLSTSPLTSSIFKNNICYCVMPVLVQTYDMGGDLVGLTLLPLADMYSPRI
jgi:hypothetical protein